MSDRFQNIYRIPSARVSWHDYDGGMYHVIACTAGREHYFGTIGDDQHIVLSDIGEYTKKNIEQIGVHYPYAEIPLFAIMPDHIHMIIFINNPVETLCTPSINNDISIDYETMRASSLQRSERWKGIVSMKK